jgi:Trk K+ transport system NAD-binding subunit
MTVIGWFYGIGTVVALIQDKVLLEEIERSKFMSSVKDLNEPFILIFGYNNITKKLIGQLSKIPKRMVVVDKNQVKIDTLNLENYHPHIPAFHGNMMDASVLEMAGILSKNCTHAVIVFENEYKNTQIAMICKNLNKDIKLIVRSDTLQNSEYLYQLDIDHIENPFKVISNRLHLALTAPSLWMLEMWVHGHPLRIDKKEKIPQGKYVIFGYGRMGVALENGLIKAGIDYVFIDASHIFVSDKKLESIFSDDKLEDSLVEAGIEKASVIIAATRNDMVNLSIIMLSRKYNPDIYTIARENSLSGLSVFEAANIDRNYILEEIIANKTYNFLAMPLANAFIRLISKKDEVWGNNIVNRIIYKMGRKPHLCEMAITEREAFALTNVLKKEGSIKLKVLKRSRSNFEKSTALIFLLIKRDEEYILLPEDNFELKIGDEMLIVCSNKSETDLAYILNNYYELHYVMYGKEKLSGVMGLVYN